MECAWHFADTVNIRAKALSTNVSTRAMVSRIWAKEGLAGFGRGFSACFYGSAVAGFTYFALYKFLKDVYKELFGNNIDMAFIYLAASLTAESLTLSVQYPYDLIKCRLQSVNYVFKY